MSRRSLLIVALALVSFLVLSTCGKDSPTEDATPLPTAATTQPEIVPSATTPSGARPAAPS